MHDNQSEIYAQDVLRNEAHPAYYRPDRPYIGNNSCSHNADL